LDYQHKRIKVFVLALGNQDDVRIAASFGAYYLGHPTITDQPLAEEIPGIYMHETDPAKMVQKGMELRDIKLKTLDLGADYPILLGAAFEGESIRRSDMHVEFRGQGKGDPWAFEWVDMVEEGDISDGKVTLVGPDIDTIGADGGGKMPLGIAVKIYGRRMQKDFESVLERRLHDFMNSAEGLWMWLSATRSGCVSARAPSRMASG
jgi:acetyl-CoA synthase